MPATVSHAPSQVGQLLAGATGAFQGKAEGLQFNEKQRQFNEELNQRTHQFDADLALKVDTLVNLDEQGLLDRDQQTKLEKMQEQASLYKQKDQQAADATEAVKGRVFTAGENEAQRGVQRYDIKTRKQESDYATYVRDKGQTQDFQTRSQDREDTSRKLDVIGRSLASGITRGSPGYEQAFKEFQTYINAPGSTTGQHMIDQVTPAKTAQDRAEFERFLDPAVYKAEVKRHEDLVQGDAMASAAGRSGVTAPMGAQVTYGTADLFDYGNKTAYGTPSVSKKMADGSPSPLWVMYGDTIITPSNAVVADLDIELAKTDDPAAIEIAKGAASQKIESYLKTASNLSPVNRAELQDHFDSMIAAAAQSGQGALVGE